MDKRNSVFFLILTMELFSIVLSYLTAQLEDKHKSNIKGGIFDLRSSHLFQDQLYKEVLEVKCLACNFTDGLSFTDIFDDFGRIFLTCFWRTSDNLIRPKE